MAAPVLYTAFHLNLAFSSIEEEARPTVIERCYWPLLRLAESGFPLGVEITSFTLKTVQAIDPEWIKRLAELIREGRIELIASGFVQMIAPLVPPDITRRNFEYGLRDYEEILGVRPRIALVNEQAYAPGLVPIYRGLGFEALIMDWAEPASHHAEWPADMALAPQMIAGADGSEIPVIWSDAISFQKFQRYVHGELDPEDYVEFLTDQLGNGARALPLYTNDAEIFDFRPGRFATEAAIAGVSEFERIRVLLTALSRMGDIRLGVPSDVLALLDPDGPRLRLECPSVPVPVKKQRKYNLTRWGVTGRDDLSLNTYCWRHYEALKARAEVGEVEWRDLCLLWASDFRTHITEKRWLKMLGAQTPVALPAFISEAEASLPDDIQVTLSRRYLMIETPKFHLMLKLFRGLVIQSFGFGPAGQQITGSPGPDGLVGTLAHGFYRDILFGADFYTGHLIFEPHNSAKVTDLAACTPTWRWLPDARTVEISADIPTAMGKVHKTLRFEVDSGRVEIAYAPLWDCPVDGTLRIGHVTLNPRAFDQESLYFACHNGSDTLERHELWHQGRLLEIDHGRPVSRLVTAQTALGMTGGVIELGDVNRWVRLEMKRTDAAGVGMLSCQSVGDSFFVRAAVSLRECDETSVRPALGASERLGAPVIRYAIVLGPNT
ncbi:MAG: glycoside hydrolase family 57 [Alphaproteobacteria bacterium]|nr:MAG: glycoside hydrolase family 57 [Alphaproteobacteria bacterium]